MFTTPLLFYHVLVEAVRILYDYMHFNSTQIWKNQFKKVFSDDYDKYQIHLIPIKYLHLKCPVDLIINSNHLTISFSTICVVIYIFLI